jgi:hypothetical protein
MAEMPIEPTVSSATPWRRSTSATRSAYAACRPAHLVDRVGPEAVDEGVLPRVAADREHRIGGVEIDQAGRDAGRANSIPRSGPTGDLVAGGPALSRGAMTAERLDDPATDRVVADDRERADRDGAAELIRHRRDDARDLLAARRHATA